MRTSAVEMAFLVSAMIFIACSGGADRGTIAGPGPTPTEPGEGVERGDNPFDFQSNGSQVTSAETVTTSTSTGGCTTCADVLDGSFTMDACSRSEQAIVDIFNCGCAGVCETDCEESFCLAQGIDSTCAGCLTTQCQTELLECQDN